MAKVIEIERLQDPLVIGGPQRKEDLIPTARKLCLDLLRPGGAGIKLTKEQLDRLEATRVPDAIPAGNEGFYVWGGERLVRNGETIVVGLPLVVFLSPGPDRMEPARFDVLEGGIRIAVHTGEQLRILASSATEIALPCGLSKLQTPLAQLSNDELLELLTTLLDLPSEVLGDVSLTRVILHEAHPTAAAMARPPSPPRVRREPSERVRGAMAARVEINDGFRAAVMAQFVTEDRYGRRMGYRVAFDHASILSTTWLTAAARASVFVFPNDPRTSAGPTASKPNDYCDRLDAYKQNRTSPELDPPAAGRQTLDAAHFRQLDGPARPTGTAFDFHARTRDFAATSACFHLVGIVELAEKEFGFPRTDLFPANSDAPGRRITIWPHAPISTGFGDGRCINAQVIQGLWPYSIDQIRFALADLSDPNNRLGLAADRRYVWHEFCHALIAGATNELEFRFAHTAGDALAAIDADPHSALRGDTLWRGVTFPWVEGPKRRHDRKVEDGWSWLGQMYDPANYPPSWDPAGYRAEQILSTTLFRVYQSLGGDSADLARRTAASRYLLYLIIRAIETAAIPPYTIAITTPEGFANLLMQSDAATPSFGQGASARPGGTLYKVVRWSFEKQGAYFPAGTAWPQNRSGPAPAIDVYFDDAAGRDGEYGFTDSWEATDASLWTAATPDPTAPRTAPVGGVPCFVFARARNRGSLDALNTTLAVHAARGADVDIWNAATWTLLPLAAGGVDIAEVPAGGRAVFGPFLWTPPQCGTALLASASAPPSGGAPGDRSNIDVPFLPCRNGPVAIADLVPHDNNLAYRRWSL